MSLALEKSLIVLSLSGINTEANTVRELNLNHCSEFSNAAKRSSMCKLITMTGKIVAI